jgi:pyocin large subunit-like protein
VAHWKYRKMPFANDSVRDLHYQKHINEFPFISAVEYEAEADAFMAGAAIPPARECTRANGDRVRFNRNTRYFVVQAASGNLKTFHKISDKFMALGYFNWECSRTV